MRHCMERNAINYKGCLTSTSSKRSTHTVLAETKPHRTQFQPLAFLGRLDTVCKLRLCLCHSPPPRMLTFVELLIKLALKVKLSNGVRIDECVHSSVYDGLRSVRVQKLR